MRRVLYSVVVGIAVICAPVAMTAQDAALAAREGSVVPNLVQFNGEAVDARGAALSGELTVAFALYAAETGGEALWRETQRVNADKGGRYAVSLGATGGISAELFANGEARWLGVQVEGQPEERRVLLVSVPYALKARDAETLGGLPASAFALAAANAAVPAPTGEGAPRSEISPQASPTGAGTSGYLPIWSSASTLGNSALFQTGTGSSALVGVGTTVPATLLDVNGLTTFRQLVSLVGRTATATTGSRSAQLQFSASAFKAGGAAIAQNYFLQAEPIGNDTATPTSRLALYSQIGTASAIETGFSIAPSGVVTFAPGQTFPGTVSTNLVNSTTGYDLGSEPFDTGNFSNGNASLGFSSSPQETGVFNLGVGKGALAAVGGGEYNIAVGGGSMQAEQGGIYNTAVGYNSLSAQTNGIQNTAVGYNAGQSPFGSDLRGYHNTYIGANAGPGSTSNLTEAAAIGYNATVNSSYALVLGGTGSDAVVVGIGTATPYYDYALDVDATTFGNPNGGVVVNAGGGNLYLGMTNGTHKFRVDTNGNVFGAQFLTSGADFAESVAVRGKRSEYEPGDLLAIDPGGTRRLTLARTPYSTLVAGIYSTQPGMLASPHRVDDEQSRTGEAPLAVMGIVPCKATAENGPIRVGDLLVTSSRPGYAMKGTDRRRMLGAVVGKALEALPAGTGAIQVLVTLQ